MKLENIVKAPKTTVAGIILLVLIGLVVFDVIDTQQFAELVAALGAVGLIVSADPQTEPKQ